MQLACPQCETLSELEPVTVIRPGSAEQDLLFRGEINQTSCPECGAPLERLIYEYHVVENASEDGTEDYWAHREALAWYVFCHECQTQFYQKEDENHRCLITGIHSVIAGGGRIEGTTGERRSLLPEM